MSKDRTNRTYNQLMPSPSFEYPHAAWDVEAMFRAAGGVSKLMKLLEENDFDVPEEDTAYMWRYRGRIPADWLPTVLLVLLRAGKGKLSDFIRIIGGDAK